MFTIILFFMAVTSEQLQRMNNKVDHIYNHPFVVSNAAKKINLNIISMHSYLKDIISAKSIEDRELAITLLTNQEAIVL